MYCQRCKKQSATVHVTDLIKGEKRERHLCEGCAVEEGVTPAKTVIPVSDLLSTFLSQKAGVAELAKLHCPHCKMTFVEFRNHGLLGCAADYDALERALVPLIERAHEGFSHHVGKVPQRLGAGRPPTIDDLNRLRQELSKALNEEKYERAAEIRDRIRTLESQ